MKTTTDQLTIGIDLGDRRHHVCVLSASGEIIAEEVLPNTRECLCAYAARYPGATIIMETGTHSPWVSRLLEQRGHPVLVANARKLRAISRSHTKNDTEDARMLARLGRADPALLSPIQHRSEHGQRALVRLKVRAALVRSRVNLINSVRFLLKSLGEQADRVRLCSLWLNEAGGGCPAGQLQKQRRRGEPRRRRGLTTADGLAQLVHCTLRMSPCSRKERCILKAFCSVCGTWPLPEMRR